LLCSAFLAGCSADETAGTALSPASEPIPSGADSSAGGASGSGTAGVLSEQGSASSAVSSASSSASSAASGTYDLTGAKISVCGDSISTFEGTIPADYNDFYPAKTDITSVDLTWWSQVIAETGGMLCANASSSGSTVSGDLNDAKGFCFGSTRRLDDLAGTDGSSPDIILILGGANDIIDNIAPDTFESAYLTMLTRMRERYPSANIICMTCIPITMWDDENTAHYRPYVNKSGLTIETYNYKIRMIARNNNYPIIDSYLCGIRCENADQYTHDGTHPNAAGAAMLASFTADALKQLAASGVLK
jgi:lysophospholipase L1-like esterase